MKKTLTLFTLLLLFNFTYSKQINEQLAKNVGQAFLIHSSNNQVLKNTSSLQLVYKANSNMNKSFGSANAATLFYVFNTNATGFVIVAGDDNVTPILGYSSQSTFDPNHIPPNVAKWMEGYKSEIRYIIENNIQPNNQISQEWQNLKNGSAMNAITKAFNTVNPLLQTRWNQSPYYNASCPGGSVTGCVATAMAQIMKYWNYPATGSGFHSYNHSTYGTLSANFGSTTYQWNSMPNTVNSSNAAVATLMYQVGVSVEMNYSPQSSGAYVISNQSPITNCAEYALTTYFGYKNTLQGIERANYTTLQWMNTLKLELDANRPILYAGFGSGGGHCFVADGYDVNDYIHFNWGWSGAYDGFFQINALNPTGTGTGGGTGGYNSGHQAVIGIQPIVAGTPGNSLALYDNVTPSASIINYGQAFTVSTNIVNNGTITFNGKYAAAIFDNSNNFIDYVDTIIAAALPAGYTYSNNIVFSTAGLLSMQPGTYKVGIFYRPTGGNWIQVSNSGSYTNLVPITVVNTNDIELNSAITVNPGTTITQGQSISVNVNVVNAGNTTFIGDYGLGLYNLDGTLAQALGILSETTGLPPGYTYSAPYITFNTSALTVNPGTYYLAIQHNPNSTGWQLTGSTNYQNPITVTVIAAGLQADMYEINNTVSQSYNLPISFSGNTATKNTTGANCHITTDNDYYKIDLPAGYSYSITPRLHDSYNAGNGNTYTLDGLYSYSTDGVNWSATYDDVISSSINLLNGGTIYFHIAPYFAGETGTYLMDFTITRTITTSVTEKEADIMSIYPNPAKDAVTINLNGKINQLNLLNIQGQLVFSTTLTNIENTYNLPLTDVSKGVYFLQVQTENAILTKKLVVNK